TWAGRWAPSQATVVPSALKAAPEEYMTAPPGTGTPGCISPLAGARLALARIVRSGAGARREIWAELSKARRRPAGAGGGGGGAAGHGGGGAILGGGELVGGRLGGEVGDVDVGGGGFGVLGGVERGAGVKGDVAAVG